MKTARRQFIGTVGAAGLALAAPAIISRRVFAASERVRRDAQEMAANDQTFKDYADAVSAMHQLNSTASDRRGWRNQALIHLNFCPHGRDTFFPWHRWYINFYEQICGELIGKKDFALPYWNWAANLGTIPNAFYDIQQLNVTYWNDPSNASSPNWAGGAMVRTVGTRGLAKGVGVQTILPDVFDQKAIDGYQAQTNYSLFRSAIEGNPHNNGHVIVGRPNGHMISGMSPLDPIFWLHHCNVDRLWAEWQTARNTTPPLVGNYDNQFVNAMNKPQTGINAAGSYDFKALGYTYDTLTSAAPAAVASLNSATSLVASASLSLPKPLGSVSNTAASASGQISRARIQASGLLDSMFTRRVFNATTALASPRNAMEGRRTLAKFSKIKAEGALTGMWVKVYVNAPQGASAPDDASPHYAGAFAFFGFTNAPAGAHGHDDHDFTIDITNALADLANDGLVVNDDVEITWAPQSFDPTSEKSSFTVGEIQLIST